MCKRKMESEVCRDIGNPLIHDVMSTHGCCASQVVTFLIGLHIRMMSGIAFNI
jgi:hypothetical protein